MKISRKKTVSLMLLFTILMAAIMPTIADAATVSRIENKIVNTTTYETTSFPETEGADPREHASTIYVGEVKKDGDTVLTYLYSEDVARSSVIFDNLRKALSNPYSGMVPVVTGEQTESGMKELSTNSLNEIDLTGITSGWTDASNIATQIYNGTNTDIVNSNMYDVDNGFKTEIDNSTTERAALDHPIETNKRIISHVGTQTYDSVSFKVEDSQLVEVHDVDLYYLSEATTVIYTSVNVETTPVVTEYDLYVGNTRVTSANKDNVLGDGKVTYNPTTHTLNLNDTTITTITSIQKPRDDLRSAMILSFEDELIITGKATLTNDSAKQGIMVVGSNWNGNLTINADITVDKDIWSCGNLTFSGGTTACSTAIRTNSYLTVGSSVTKITARDIWSNNGYTIEEPLQVTSGAIEQYGSNVVIEVPTQTSNTISTINISGLTQPTPGQSVPAVTVTTPGINMTSYGWWNGVSGNSATTFESGNLYELDIYFNVEGGYTLSDSYEVSCGVTPTSVSCNNDNIKLMFLLPVEYTVHFMDGTTELSTQQVVKNGHATRPTTNPVKDTYRFVDWYADSTLTTKFDFATAKITEETSVYAKFVPTPKYPQYSGDIVNSYDVTSNVVTLYVGDVAKNGTSEMKYLYTDGEVNTATLEEIRKILPTDYSAILPTTAGQVAASNKSGVTVNEEFKQAKNLASYVDPGFAYSVLDTSSSTTLYNQTEFDTLVAATTTEINAETIAETDNLAGWNERKTAWEVAEQAKIDADPEYMTVDFPEEYVKAFNDSTSYPTTSFFIADNQGTPYTGYIIKNSVMTRVDNYPIGRTIVKVVSTSANVTTGGTSSPTVITNDEINKESTIYAGEIFVDGESQMQYLYSADVSNTATVLDNLREAFPIEFATLIPTTASETDGLAVSTAHQDDMNASWTSSSNVANQYFTGTVGTETNNNLYDCNATYKNYIDTKDAERQTEITDPDPSNKRVFSLKTTTITPDWKLIGGVMTRVNTINLGFEATTVIYTTVNITSPSPCTVSFETYGGGTIPNQNLTVGQKATRPTTTPSREKCTFVNWYANENLTTLFDFDQPVAGDTTIYAGYTKDAWVDNTVDESKATIISEVVVTDVANGEQRTQETYNEKVNTLFKSTEESEEIAPKIALAKTAAQNYMSGNGYINKSSTDSTTTGKVWDNRKYESDEGVYSSTEKAIVKTHTASGTYGKEITYKTTYLADYERPKHTISFNPNGGEVSPTTKECYEGIALGELPTPTRKGYTFKGWFVNDYYGLGYKDAFEDAYFSRHVVRLAPGGSISNGLVKPGCVIVFDVTINNTVPIGADVNDNDLVSGTDFTIDGNRIYGSVTINTSHWNQWGTGTYGRYGFLDINCQDRISSYTINDFKVFKNQASTQEVTASSTMGYADMAVIAEWQLRNNTVKFDTKGGSDVANQTVTTGNKATKPDDPTKADNGFGGWYVDTTLSTPFDFNTAIDDDTIIYAKWIPYHDAVLELYDGMNTSEIGDSAENELVDDVLTLRGLMKIEEDEVNGTKSIYTGDGKLLFTIDKDGKITYAEGIGYKDNIVCPLTDEEKAMLASKGLYINNVVLSLGFEYRILEGANQTHTTNKDGSLTVRANGDISKFVTLLVDRNEVAEKDRTVVSGSTIATLKKEFLDSLSEGTHEMTFVYRDGEVSTNFTIARVNTPVETPTQSGESAGTAVASTPAAPTQVQAKSPSTGDNIYLWIILLILSTGVFIGTGISLKKNK